jgi:hypothetical protein
VQPNVLFEAYDQFIASYTYALLSLFLNVLLSAVDLVSKLFAFMFYAFITPKLPSLLFFFAFLLVLLSYARRFSLLSGFH